MLGPLTRDGRVRYFGLLGLLVAWSCSASDRDFGGGDAPLGGAGGERDIEGLPGGEPARGGTNGSPGGRPTQEGGDGGAQEPVAGLSVVATTPKDEAMAVERDGVVVVTFSADVDTATVTNESFKVDGPEGPVTGKLDVSGAKVTFTASQPLALLADYNVTLSTDIRTDPTTALDQAYAFTFQTRDGVFRTPERLTTRPAYLNQPVGNRAGHVVASWTDKLSPASNGSSITWRRFDHSGSDWSEPQQIKDQDPYAPLSTSDGAGNVMLVWSNSLGVWASRFE